METTINIRKKIHEFIENADERILRIFNGIISAEETEEDGLTGEHKRILEERFKEHRENPTEGKPWKQVKNELKDKHGI